MGNGNDNSNAVCIKDAYWLLIFGKTFYSNFVCEYRLIIYLFTTLPLHKIEKYMHKVSLEIFNAQCSNFNYYLTI